MVSRITSLPPVNKFDFSVEKMLKSAANAGFVTGCSILIGKCTARHYRDHYSNVMISNISKEAFIMGNIFLAKNLLLDAKFVQMIEKNCIYYACAKGDLDFLLATYRSQCGDITSQITYLCDIGLGKLTPMQTACVCDPLLELINRSICGTISDCRSHCFHLCLCQRSY